MIFLRLVWSIGERMNNYSRRMRIINIHSSCSLMYPQITLHYSRYFFLPTLHTFSFSLLLPLSIYFFSDAFHPLPAVAWTIKILYVINKTITHRNPFARSADVNRWSILNTRGAGGRAHEDRKEGRKRDTVAIISGTDVRGDSIIVVSVTFVRPTGRPHCMHDVLSLMSP